MNFLRILSSDADPDPVGKTLVAEAPAPDPRKYFENYNFFPIKINLLPKMTYNL